LKDSRFEVLYGSDRKLEPLSLSTPASFSCIHDLADHLNDTDVAIDFTNPEATLKLAAKAAQEKKALVVGTTGFTSNALNKLKGFSKKIPIVFSPNMSVGMNLLFKLVKDASKALAHYDIEIVEAHHNLKKDAPSGSAMRLAQSVKEGAHRSEKDFCYGREGLIGARPKKEVGILALRAGDIVGDHTVLLAGAGERLELTHRAHSRDAFAAGALDAAAWLSSKKPGFYSMQDVLGI
ncbi:MAG: 4-hydroxy-tetrahydrodipicolinate reductase, partial [Elusimicrobiota bacterium]